MTYIYFLFFIYIRDAHQDLAKIGDLDSGSDCIK